MKWSKDSSKPMWWTTKGQLTAVIEPSTRRGKLHLFFKLGDGNKRIDGGNQHPNLQAAKVAAWYRLTGRNVEFKDVVKLARAKLAKLQAAKQEKASIKKVAEKDKAARLVKTEKVMETAPAGETSAKE